MTASEQNIQSLVPPTILIIDDDVLVLKALEETLKREGYTILTAPNGRKGIEILQEHPIDLVISDQRMPGVTGVEVLKEAQTLQPDAVRIVLTGNADLETVIEAINVGHVSQYILKPWDDDFLRQAVATGIERKRLLESNRLLIEELENEHKRIRRELKLGAKIHKSLLLGRVPKNHANLSICVESIPSEEIDGDFFEFYTTTSDTIDFVIGDVMGKGLPAALVGTAVKTQLLRFAVPYTHVHQFTRARWWEEDLLNPSEVISHVHDEIVPQIIDLEYFVSLFYGRFNTAKKTFTFLDCGFTKPIHYQKQNKQAVALKGSNLPLGFVEEKNYKTVEVPYAEGDIFIFYSDGVSEARSLMREFYGYQPLIEIVEKHPDASPEELMEIIKKSILSFKENMPLADDLTLIIVKILTTFTPELKKEQTAIFAAETSQLKAVRQFVDHLCKKGLGNKALLSNQLQLAINEIFCNIVEHGYKGDKKGRVILKGELTREGIAFEISDQGVSYEPAKIKEPSFSGDRTEGFGWHLIREIADRVTYTPKGSETGWNHIYLVKKYMAEGTSMQLDHSTVNDVLIITPKNESLDAQDAPNFKEQVINLITNNDVNQVVLDLSHLEFIDSSGLGSFLSVLRILHTTGGELKLAHMNKTIRTMFELVSMHKIFEIFNTKEEAVRSFKQHG